MKRWIALAAALYPRSWREQYGREFDALLDELGPSRRVFMNVLKGAIGMQMKTRANQVKLVSATAILGAFVSLGLSWTVAPSYVSSEVIGITPQTDPARPVSPQALRQRAAADFARLKANVLSRQSLAVLINDPSLDLYRTERMRLPLGAVEDMMRRNLRIEARPSTNGGLAPVIFRVSFSYPDREKSQATVRYLARRLSQENEQFNRNRADAYRSIWQGLAGGHPVPPPPVGEIVGVLDPPGPPTESARLPRIAFAGWGLATGLVLGLMAALAIGHPRAAWQLGGFAVAGCALAACVSFLIPNRYTATAILEISPAVVAEDPGAPLPGPTPAAEFLRRM